ncbi:MAG: response regulator [Anaerolineae bacterium]|nr:response regulator [Anaerolineae bacterium]
MADVKQILVVDDQFEMLEYLRTILQHGGRDYQVLAVPSAEEGMLELLRTPFDLLITDVRLPGMSGFDLIRRVRRARPELPVIMISGYGVEQGQKEATALGIAHYFIKPLDSDLLLRAVHTTLHGEPEPAPEPEPVRPLSPSAPLTTELNQELAAAINQRLHTLRNEISATYVALADIHGRIQTDSGLGSSLASPPLLTAVAASQRHNKLLAEQLGNQEAFTMQYQSGSKTELYAVSVGDAYQLLIFFTAEARRGRVGTVWVFAQRLAKELLPQLPALSPESADLDLPDLSQESDLPDFPAKTRPTTPEAAVSPLPTVTSPELPAAIALTPDPSPQAEPPPPQPTLVEGEMFSFAEAMRQGLIPGELGQILGDMPPAHEDAVPADWLELPDQPPSDDLGDDWLAEAAADEPTAGNGLSMAEAIRLGLLPAELAQDEAAETADLTLDDLFAHAADESVDLDAFWDESAAQTDEPIPAPTPPLVEANIDDLFAVAAAEPNDLDAFWDEVVADETDSAAAFRGYSLEEALAKGLVKLDQPWSESD